MHNGRRGSIRLGTSIGRVFGLVVFALAGIELVAQAPAKPMSPEGAAHAQVLGTWVKGDRPAFTLGRESYEGGKWIEITYGRPLQRGRDLFGSGANYGKAVNDVGTVDRQLEGDDRPCRVAGDMCATDAEMVEQPSGIGRMLHEADRRRGISAAVQPSLAVGNQAVALDQRLL